MPEAGSNFMDWQQVDNESRLFADEDFSWSEPPQRRRRRMTEGTPRARRSAAEEPIPAGRRVAVLEYEPEPIDDYEPHAGYASHADYEPTPHATDGDWDQPTEVHSHFDEMMEEWNASYGSAADRRSDPPAERAFDLSHPGVNVQAHGARRTVVITGHGDDRYLPAPHRRRASELRFHERSGFSPDRAGLWAVLLSIALVIGAIAH